MKYFAHWLSNKPENYSLENYLAIEMGKAMVRPGEISPANIQDIFERKECLLILDGLDEISDFGLQEKMLQEIYTFLDWAKHLKANIKVVATSRPNEYKQQFDPTIFLHWELLQLIKEQIEEYSQKWVKTREIPQGEQVRILETLEECEQSLKRQIKT